MNRHARAIAAVIGLFALLQAPAFAQSYPTRPVRVIVPFGVGAGTDMIGRVVTQKLGERMKANFVVENREGAGGALGFTAAARAPADGYTIMFCQATLTVNPHMQSAPAFDPVKDFIPIAQVAEQPLILVTSPDAPYKSLKEMVAYARANPGKLSYATSGKGTPSHLAVELIRQAIGIDVRDVPYRNTGQAVTDTIGGQVSFFFSGLSAVLPIVKSGRLRALAIGTVKRYGDAPNVPTLAEEIGVNGLELITWYGFFAPAGTPKDIVARLHAEVSAVMELPDVRETLSKAGATVVVASPEAFANQVSKDNVRYAKLIQQLGLKE